MLSVNTEKSYPRAIWVPDFLTHNTAEEPMSELYFGPKMGIDEFRKNVIGNLPELHRNWMYFRY
jgi:hypothetical protein